MRVRQARSRFPTFVEKRKDVSGLSAGSSLPRLCDEVELRVFQVADRAHVAPALNDDLLSLERGIEVRDDAYAPVPLVREHERLRRRHVLVPRTERTRLEFLRRRRVELWPCRSGTPRTTGCDHGDAAGVRVAAKLAAQPLPS
jgi:hypothetical protein